MYLGFKFSPVKEKFSALTARTSVCSPAGIDCIKDRDGTPPKSRNSG
jgi:hypothetical protein